MEAMARERLMAQIGGGEVEIEFVPVSIATTMMLACELLATAKCHVGFGVIVVFPRG